jgi:pimeloyl-ACP methyl ester carboxylesterase
MMAANRLFFGLARRLPWLHRLLLSMSIRAGAEAFLHRMRAALADVDKAVLASLEGGTEDLVQAFRNGVRGPAWDQRLLACPWGFRLGDITLDVFLWQGDRDVMVPVHMGQYLARTILKCQATFCPNEGHMLVFPRWPEILLELTRGR